MGSHKFLSTLYRNTQKIGGSRRPTSDVIAELLVELNAPAAYIIRLYGPNKHLKSRWSKAGSERAASFDLDSKYCASFILRRPHTPGLGDIMYWKLIDSWYVLASSNSIEFHLRCRKVIYQRGVIDVERNDCRRLTRSLSFLMPNDESFTAVGLDSSAETFLPEYVYPSTRSIPFHGHSFNRTFMKFCILS